MHRSLIATTLAAFIAMSAVAQPVFANQDGGARQFSVTALKGGDIHQQTLQVVDPASTRTSEVFPGTYTSPYGALVMKRIEDLFARVGEADRAALLENKVGAGFDRSIISWDAELTRGTVVVAVHYYRGRLSSHLGMELSDDYGRPEPLDPAEYEFFTIAVCSRTGVGSWTCREEELAAVAKKHAVALPNDRAGRDAAAKELVKLVLRQQ